MTGFKPHRIYGIIGCPLGHSLSPLLHTTAFQHLNIPAVLTPWEIRPERLVDFIGAMRLLNIQGACVTIPHKEAVLPLLDELSEGARLMGAVNLIYRQGDLLCGDNTDISGFTAPIKNQHIRGDRVLILGAGGAARAVAAGLKSLGLVDLTVANRNQDRAEPLAETLGLKVVDWADRQAVQADLIINDTPLGMRGQMEDRTPYEAQWFFQGDARGLAYDLIYNPLTTRFLKEAEEAGWRTISGLEMFLGQADQQFFTWIGQRLPQAARMAVREALTG